MRRWGRCLAITSRRPFGGQDAQRSLSPAAPQRLVPSRYQAQRKTPRTGVRGAFINHWRGLKFWVRGQDLNLRPSGYETKRAHSNQLFLLYFCHFNIKLCNNLCNSFTQLRARFAH